jgi:guanylate kinase
MSSEPPPDHAAAAAPVRGSLFVVSAPSGAGKTSLVRALVAVDPRVVISVSHTTRTPRPGERDGDHYHFVDAPTFERMRRQDAFLESAQVFDKAYGTSRAAVDAQLDAGRDVILEIDWQGARQVRERRAECVTVFVLPPSLAQLRARLEARGQDGSEVVARRMGDAVAEIAHHDEYEYLLVNDDFDTALEELRAVVTARRLQGPPRRRALAPLLGALLGPASGP